MNHPHTHTTPSHDVQSPILLDEANIPRARGTSTVIQPIDESPYILVEESTDAQPTLEGSAAASDGSLRDSEPDTRSLYERYPGNYPFPTYHRTGKKHANGRDIIQLTIPPQAVNYESDRKKFDVEAIRILSAELGWSFGRARFAHLIRSLIPRMVQS